MRLRLPHLLLAAILIALPCALVGAVKRAGLSLKQAACKGHLQYLAHQFLFYRERHGHYPPAISPGNSTTPPQSWRALLSTEMDGTLPRTYDFAQPWNSPGNLAAFDRIKSVFACPTNQGTDARFTNFVAVIDHGVSTIEQAELIPKGDSDEAKQVLLVEYPNSDILPAEPRDLDIEDLSKLSVGADPDGIGVIFANITFRRVSPQELKKLLGR